MPEYDENYPHPQSAWGRQWRERCARKGLPEPYGYQVIVDGIPWEDADGNDTWDTEGEANSVAGHCERQGIHVRGSPTGRNRDRMTGQPVTAAPPAARVPVSPVVVKINLAASREDCDGCPGQALWRVMLESGRELLLCGHHAREGKLVPEEDSHYAYQDESRQQGSAG